MYFAIGALSLQLNQIGENHPPLQFRQRTNLIGWGCVFVFRHPYASIELVLWQGENEPCPQSAGRCLWPPPPTWNRGIRLHHRRPGSVTCSSGPLFQSNFDDIARGGGLTDAFERN